MIFTLKPNKRRLKGRKKTEVKKMAFYNPMPTFNWHRSEADENKLHPTPVPSECSSTKWATTIILAVKVSGGELKRSFSFWLFILSLSARRDGGKIINQISRRQRKERFEYFPDAFEISATREQVSPGFWRWNGEEKYEIGLLPFIFGGFLLLLIN